MATWHDSAGIKNGKPLLVTTALGTYAIKLTKLAGTSPIIVIGGGIVSTSKVCSMSRTWSSTIGQDCEK